LGAYLDAGGFAHGYLQKRNQYTTVADPAGAAPGFGSFANGINDPGQIVRGYVDAS
jgi:hypothetical protein